MVIDSTDEYASFRSDEAIAEHKRNAPVNEASLSSTFATELPESQNLKLGLSNGDQFLP
jgi:hypothetical protein